MFGLGLGRCLPTSMRVLIERAVIRIRSHIRSRNLEKLSKWRTPKAFDGRHVVVAGFFGTTTGLGRAAELVALTLEGAGSKITRVDITDTLRMQVQLTDTRFVLPSDSYELDCTDVVFVCNPGVPIIGIFDLQWLVQRCVVGHWIWEIETLPRFWKKATVSVDEIWAPTQLLLDVFKKELPHFSGSMKVVPYAIAADPTPKCDLAERERVRSSLKIAEIFVVGYSFAVGSNYYRKNPEDLVRAFHMAFPDLDDRSVCLFLRANDFKSRPIERRMLEQAIGSDKRVQIFDSENPISISDFYAALDVYVSPSRAEGYGLNLVEASQSGLPVITNGWRIPQEITSLTNIKTTGFEIVEVSDPQGHYSGIRGAKWSAPNISEMASLMVRQREIFTHRCKDQLAKD
jgi:hypothetical protein